MSLIGDKMASLSGLRSIMEDIAASTAAGSEWLNLGIGNPARIPAVDAFWHRLTQQALAADFTTASCQYGASRGMPQLVAAIADYFRGRYGWPVGPENVIVGPGSQLLGFIAAAMHTGPGLTGTRRLVLPMLPDYTGYQGLCLHADGIVGVAPGIHTLGERGFHYSLDRRALATRDDIGMLLLSSPSNPTGRSVRPDELDTLVSLAQQREVPLFIDHAYGAPFPRIGATPAPPPWHPDVINCFTFSKAGLPGERIGFAIGAKRHISAMVSFLANSALHAPQLVQTVATRALAHGELDRLVSETITPFYLARRTLAERLLADAMPRDVHWRLHSAGGGSMFCWLWIDHDWFDDLALYELLKRKKVFIVPGRHFFTGIDYDEQLAAHRTRCFRISLSVAEPVLSEGIRRLAETLTEMAAGGLRDGRAGLSVAAVAAPAEQAG